MNPAAATESDGHRKYRTQSPDTERELEEALFERYRRMSAEEKLGRCIDEAGLDQLSECASLSRLVPARVHSPGPSAVRATGALGNRWRRHVNSSRHGCTTAA